MTVRTIAPALALAALSACATAHPPRPAAAPEAPAPRTQDTAPVVRTIEIIGADAFPRATVLRFVRLHEGARLRREPAEVAHALQERYRIQGYLGAEVTAAFAADTGVFTLTVDEGRLAEVVLEGVEGSAAEAARRELALTVGQVLREKDVRTALSRLEDRSTGAYSRAPGTSYVAERGPQGVRLRVLLVQHRSRLVVWPDGPDPSPLSNRVEGFAPGVGASLTLFDPVGFNHADLYGRVSYGFASKAARYAVGARRPFGGNRSFVLGAEAHDLTDTDDSYRHDSLMQPPGKVLAFSVTEEYFRRKGYEAYAVARPTPRVQLAVSYRSDDYESMAVLKDDHVFFVRHDPRVNPEIDEGRMSSVLVTARLAGRDELFSGWKDEREAFLVRNPYGARYDRAQRFRVDSTFENTVGGDFSFRRLIGNVRGTHDLGAHHSLSARVIVGLTGGAPPLQRRFALGGAGTLRGYGFKEFTGENMLLATAEWSIRFPSRYPGLVAFYDGGSAWTRDQDGAGWHDDVGLGLEWPGGGRSYLRLDVGVPLHRTPGADALRLHALLRFPF